MHRRTARYHRRYRAIVTPKNPSVPAGHGYVSVHHDCVYAPGHVNVHGHHVNGRVRDHDHANDRDGGRVRDRDRLHADGRGRVNGRGGVDADVHAYGCLLHHCSTASCFW